MAKVANAPARVAAIGCDLLQEDALLLMLAADHPVNSFEAEMHHLQRVNGQEYMYAERSYVMDQLILTVHAFLLHFPI